jgi:hypothetical protein
MGLQFNIEGPETRKARELTQALQEEQLKRYQEDRMAREYEASRQVMPFENFKINVGGEMVDFRALSPEQKQAWKQQQEMNWMMDQSVKMENYKKDMTKAQVEMDKLNAERSKIATEINKGNVRPGLDILPITKPYTEQMSEIDARIKEQQEKYMRAGFGAQSMTSETMPKSYGIPPIIKPQPAQPTPSGQQAQQAQAQQAPAQQPAQVPSYADEAAAKAAGAKAGDIVILQNVKKADGTVGPAKVRLTR